MRTKIIVALCITLFTCSSLTIGQIQLEDQQITLSLSFSQPVYAQSHEFSSFIIPEAKEIFMKPSYFMQPMRTETYYLPSGTVIDDVKVVTSTIHKISTSNPFNISPTPVLLSTGEPINTLKNSEPKTIDTWFGFNVGHGIIDGELYTILSIEIYPMLYDQKCSELLWVEEIEVTITTISPQKNNPVTYDEIYELLIISPQDYVEELSDFVEHKLSRNISTKLVTIQEITSGIYFPATGRDVQEEIKYFIKKSSEQWGTSYVLLVGGSAAIPIRETHIKVSSGDYEVFASDLYYADIYNESGAFSSWDTNNNDLFAEYEWGDEKQTDELDFYPDIYLGRLACVSESEVQGVVQKIITYENNRSYTTDWFTNLITVGGDSFTDEYGDDTGTNEGEVVNEQIIGIMEGFIPNRIWSSNGKLGGVSPTGVSEIESAFLTGAGFVDFSGHGNTYVYATHHTNGSTWIPTPTGGLLNNQISQFDNAEKLPIVVTGACSVGKFNKDDDCFSWSFVSNPNGGGVASVGATALGYGYIGKWVTSGLIEKIAINMFDAYMEGAMTFGEMWADAISSYISLRMDGGDYKTVLEWQPFGDPTLALGELSEPPLTPDAPEGPEKGRVKESITFFAQTTDPDGDDVYYLFDWGNDAYSGWLGPYESGEIAEASYQWDKRGDHQIRVKAKDIHGTQSDWSDPVPIAMPHRVLFILPSIRDFVQRGMMSQRILEPILQYFPALK